MAMRASSWIYFGLATLAAAALPWAVMQLDQEVKAYHMAEMRADAMTRSQTSRVEFLEQLRNYKGYAKKVNAFVEEARRNRMSSGCWLQYDVSIDHQLMEVAEMRTVLANARSGLEYFFDLDRFELLSTYHAEFDKALKGTQYLKTASVAGGGAQVKVDPGTAVLLTLKGRYFVDQGGCDKIKPNVVVVLPEADGHVGAVTVKQGGQSVLLDKPFLSAQSGRVGQLETSTLDQSQVQQIFGAAMAAKPIPPVSFTLYFKPGSLELTPESQPEMDKLFEEVARRPSPEVMVIGHTDTVGKTPSNDALSLKRAESVRESLIAKGIGEKMIQAAGRGEREPLVATPDETDEPKNRRTEISIR
ncbi:MAG: OmpA family protein [Magnetococcales bacterium]|nr:OmpA family protein [Magnetococcales bacterium]